MTMTSTATGYNDDDLVYVDPETRTVVGRLEFLKNDQPKSLPYQRLAVPKNAKDGKAEDRGQFWRKYYPFGTYRSMKRIYKIEGKVKDPEPQKTLDEVLPKALSEAFWEWKEDDRASKPSST